MAAPDSATFPANSRVAYQQITSLRRNEKFVAEANAKQLLVSARKGELDVVEEALRNGVSVNLRDDRGHTPLMLCCIDDGAHPVDARPRKRPSAEIAELLINHKAAVNATGPGGWTPLFFSSFYCDLGVTDVLLKSNADVLMLDAGNRPASSWVRYGTPDRDLQKALLKKLYKEGFPQPTEARVKANLLPRDFFAPIVLDARAKTVMAKESQDNFSLMRKEALAKIRMTLAAAAKHNPQTILEPAQKKEEQAEEEEESEESSEEND